MTTRTTVDATNVTYEIREELLPLLDALADAQYFYDRAERAFDHCPERRDFEEAKANLKTVRDGLFAVMEALSIDTTKDHRNTVVVTQRHDYIIADDDALWETLPNPEEFRQWDLTKIKKLASRRFHDGDPLDGVEVVAKRWLTVSPKDGE